MKILPITVILLLFHFSLTAQECTFTDNFMGQATIDNFAQNYPGCKVLKANFRTSAAVTNLEGLAQLEGIKGNFEIKCKTVNLDGLQNLEYVMGVFSINSNRELEDISALAKLKSADHLKIHINDKLPNLQGLNQLETVGRLDIQSNWALTDISALENLQKITQDFILENNVPLETITGINNLDTIQGDLFIDHRHPNLKSIDGLNGLDYVGGQLQFKDLFVESISGFNELKEVGGKLIVTECDDLTSISGFSQLYEVHEDFQIIDNPVLAEITGFDLLHTIGQRLDITDNPLLEDFASFKNLTKASIIGISGNHALTTLFSNATIDSVGLLFISNNYKLLDLKGFEPLDRIDNDLSIGGNPELKSLDGLNNLTSIGGSLTIGSNQKLEDILALSKLSNLGGSLSLTRLNALESLNGLNQLDRINGRLSLSRIPLIDDLDGLENIQSVDGDLGLAELDRLQNFKGLENLIKINGSLGISGNEALIALDGLQNIDPKSISVGAGDDVIITLNPMLARCDIENICALLYLPNREFHIDQNQEGCNTPQEIRCINNGLAGKVFIDLNQNGLQDTLEAALPNIAIEVEPLGLILLTDESGRYYFPATEGTAYTISISDQQAWAITTNSLSYNKIFVKDEESNDQNDFGLYPLVERHEGLLNISSYATRCNEETQFILKYINTGNFIENGKVVLYLDSLTSFISASVTPDIYDQEARILEWQFDSLYPYEFREISVFLNMPNETFTEEQMDFRGELVYESDNAIQETSYSPKVLCAYDPNDIIASPPGVEDEHYTPLGTPLQYTIRFQNTGNAPANDVRILDTLDTDLSVRTFKVLNSSFPVSTYLRENAIEFRFDNIRLPDSTSNEPNSHGFVTYYVETNPNTVHGTLVENTAHIIFDFNPPIVTNTAFNTFVEETTAVSTKEVVLPNLKIFPNPVSDQLYITTDEGSIRKVQLYNMLGIEVLETNTMPIDVSRMSKGIYVIRVEVIGKGIVSSRVVITNN